MTTERRYGLTIDQYNAVRDRFKIVCVARVARDRFTWAYQPHDFDGSFELWSPTFATRREAVRAAYAELSQAPSTPEGD